MNRDVDSILLGKLEDVETEYLYKPPNNESNIDSIDSSKLKFRRHILMLCFALTLLSVILPFALLEAKVNVVIIGYAHIVEPFISMVLGVLTLAYVYLVSSMYSSATKSFFLALAGLLPLFNLYVIFRTIYVSKKHI